MTKRKWSIIGTILFILITSYGLMKFLIAQKPDLPMRPVLVNERWVKAQPVQYQTLLSPILAKGRVVSTAEVALISEASGRIERGEVALKKGQSFRKGQILFSIYKDEAELALKAQKSQFLNTIANLLPDIKIDYAQYYETYQSFFDKIKLDQPLPPLPEVSDHAFKIFLSSRNILSDYYSILQAELKLSRYSVRAPFNGVLSNVTLEVGAYANAGGQVGSMLATDALEVDVAVENSNAQWIKVGDPVSLTSVDRKQNWKGTVTRVSEYVDESTQSRSVFVQVPITSQSPLYAGEYVDAEFKGAYVDQVMQIPRNALFNFNEVFTVREGLLKVNQVEVIKLNQTTALFRGIDEGVYIVTQPLINVAENTAVKILGVDVVESPKRPQAGTDSTKIKKQH